MRRFRGGNLQFWYPCATCYCFVNKYCFVIWVMNIALKSNHLAPLYFKMHFFRHKEVTSVRVRFMLYRRLLIVLIYYSKFNRVFSITCQLCVKSPGKVKSASPSSWNKYRKNASSKGVKKEQSERLSLHFLIEYDFIVFVLIVKLNKSGAYSDLRIFSAVTCYLRMHFRFMIVFVAVWLPSLWIFLPYSSFRESLCNAFGL